MSLRGLKLNGAYLGAAMLCGAGLAACLLPDYKNGCPAAPYTARFGSDADRSEWSAFTRAPDGTSAIAGVFYTSLTWTNGKTITATVTDPVSSDAFIVGMDSSGEGAWAVTVAGPESEGVLRLVPVDGGFLAIGAATGAFTVGDLASPALTGEAMGWVAKITNDGTVSWLDTFRVEDGMNNAAALVDAVVEPATGDIILIGDARGTLTIDRVPDAVPAVAPMALASTAPFYVHLDANGRFRNESALQVWPGNSQTLVTRVLLAPDGSRYVLGGYSGIFPDAHLQNPPPLKNGLEGFVMRIDASDVPQEAFRFGSDERHDVILDGYLSGDSLYLLFQSEMGTPPPTMPFDLGGTAIDVSAFDVRGGVVGRVTTSGQGVWGQTFTLDGDFTGSISERNGAPLVSMRFQPMQVTYDGHSFTTEAQTNTVFLQASADDGHLVEAFDFGPMGLHFASLLGSPCGDTVFGTFAQGPVTFGGQTFSPTTRNVFVSFQPELDFTPM